TFYVPTEGGWSIQAEGFSTSIARAFEADDLDDLPDARPSGGSLTLAMRNEALETHAVRSLAVLAVEGPAGSAVLRRPDGTLGAAGPSRAPVACTWDGADAPDVCALVGERDGRELSPSSDGVDLGARTAITLRYAGPGSAHAGLVLTARNSL